MTHSIDRLCLGGRSLLAEPEVTGTKLQTGMEAAGMGMRGDGDEGGWRRKERTWEGPVDGKGICRRLVSRRLRALNECVYFVSQRCLVDLVLNLNGCECRE